MTEEQLQEIERRMKLNGSFGYCGPHVDARDAITSDHVRALIAEVRRLRARPPYHEFATGLEHDRS